MSLWTGVVLVAVLVLVLALGARRGAAAPEERPGADEEFARAGFVPFQGHPQARDHGDDG